jgi:hypothetical protein
MGVVTPKVATVAVVLVKHEVVMGRVRTTLKVATVAVVLVKHEVVMGRVVTTLKVVTLVPQKTVVQDQRTPSTVQGVVKVVEIAHKGAVTPAHKVLQEMAHKQVAEVS